MHCSAFLRALRFVLTGSSTCWGQLECLRLAFQPPWGRGLALSPGVGPASAPGRGPALPGASLRSGCRRLLAPSPGELWGVWSPAAAGDPRPAPSEPGSQRRPTRRAGSEHRGTRRAGWTAWAEQVVTATE